MDEVERSVEKKFMQIVDEKMKALELGNECIGLDNLPSYDDGMYPEKFRIPEFEKYDGTGCPITHQAVRL